MAEKLQRIGWQFRYVFHDQSNRRSEWGSVLPLPRNMKNGDKALLGEKGYHFEVRDVFAGPVGGGMPDGVPGCGEGKAE